MIILSSTGAGLPPRRSGILIARDLLGPAYVYTGRNGRVVLVWTRGRDYPIARLPLHSRIDFMPSRRPQAHRTCSRQPASSASPRVATILGYLAQTVRRTRREHRLHSGCAIHSGIKRWQIYSEVVVVYLGGGVTLYPRPSKNRTAAIFS